MYDDGASLRFPPAPPPAEQEPNTAPVLEAWTGICRELRELATVRGHNFDRLPPCTVPHVHIEQLAIPAAIAAELVAASAVDRQLRTTARRLTAAECDDQLVVFEALRHALERLRLLPA